jgi:predicted DNA-binding protein
LPKSKGKTETVSIRISRESYEKLKVLAKENGRMLSGQLAVMVNSFPKG